MRGRGFGCRSPAVFVVMLLSSICCLLLYKSVSTLFLISSFFHSQVVFLPACTRTHTWLGCLRCSCMLWIHWFGNGYFWCLLGSLPIHFCGFLPDPLLHATFNSNPLALTHRRLHGRGRAMLPRATQEPNQKPPDRKKEDK